MTTTTRLATVSQPQPRWGKPRSWARRHRPGLAICGALLIIVGAVNLWNLQGWPGYLDDDEGTYIAQAWAVIHLHHLAPYTYWYDHPMGGWLLMAGYLWLTGGFARYPMAVMAGREFMWAITIVSCGLLYCLARRFSLSRWASAVAVVLFGLSPLAIYFHRMVWLDNIGTMWMLGALVVAASPRRSVGTAIGSALLMAAAFWCKETMLLIAPAWMVIVWRGSGPRHRAFWLALSVFATVGVAGYLLLAALRGELFAGPGHVSLIWAIKWQLFGRASSGSIFNHHSQTWGLAKLWYHQDPWLVAGGLTAAAAASFIRRLWPVVLAVAIQILVLIHGGYTPYAFIIAALPFLVLAVAGVLDTLWRSPHRTATKYLGRGLALTSAACFVAVIAPSWARSMVSDSRVSGQAATMAAEQWVELHVPAGDVVALNDYMWVDLRTHSKVHPLWVWKIDLDPWVMTHVLPHGWKSINYVVWTPGPTGLSPGELPTLAQALRHGAVVKQFGSSANPDRLIQIYEVKQ